MIKFAYRTKGAKDKKSRARRVVSGLVSKVRNRRTRYNKGGLGYVSPALYSYSSGLKSGNWKKGISILALRMTGVLGSRKISKGLSKRYLNVGLVKKSSYNKLEDTVKHGRLITMSNFERTYNAGAASAFEEAGISEDQAVEMWKIAMEADLGGIPGGVPVEQKGDVPPMAAAPSESKRAVNSDNPSVDFNGITSKKLGSYTGTHIKSPAGASTSNTGNVAGGLGLKNNEHLIPSTQRKKEAPNFAQLKNNA